MIKLTTRERNLAALAITAVFSCAVMLVGQEFLNRKSAAEKDIALYKSKKDENEAYLAARDLHEKRQKWLDATMPTTDSLGRAQGQLLEDLQNQLLDLGMKIERTTLNDPTKNEHYQEVAVNLIIHGDQALAMEWLATLQSPESYQVIKTLNIDPDSRSKEKTPQANVNVTIARWFKPEGTS